MGLGIRLAKLWQLRTGVLISVVLALLVSLWSVQQISLFPPGLTPRSLEMATASTHVVIDTPTSTLLDLRQDVYSLEALTGRGIVLGNVMANGRVRASIASRANVPVETLQITAPLTRKQPRARVESSNEKRPSDILKSTDQYRLTIFANPTVPILDIYSQTPTAASAEALANAAVDALRAYLDDLTDAARTPQAAQIRLLQLGRAKGAVINEGVNWQVAFIAFFLTFAASCATVIFLSRARMGWRMAAFAERPTSG